MASNLPGHEGMVCFKSSMSLADSVSKPQYPDDLEITSSHVESSTTTSDLDVQTVSNYSHSKSTLLTVE